MVYAITDSDKGTTKPAAPWKHRRVQSQTFQLLCYNAIEMAFLHSNWRKKQTAAGTAIWTLTSRLHNPHFKRHMIIYIQMCWYIYIYIYLYIFRCVYIYTDVYIYMYIYTNTLCIFKHVCNYVCIYTLTHRTQYLIQKHKYRNNT